MYSVFRNLNWIVELSDRTIQVLRFLGFGFFIWFFGVNIFLASRKNSRGWNKTDYLSPYVVLATLAIIMLLEYLVYL
jgi:hypothetical protein